MADRGDFSSDRGRDRSRSRSPPRGGGGGGKGGRSTGVALRWNEKGFGFIKPDDGGEDLFCHFSGIEDGKCLIQGNPVEFMKTYDERKGKERAEQVTGGAPEPEGGGFGGGGGGPGESRPGDWTCPDCGANVFASKSACFKCD